MHKLSETIISHEARNFKGILLWVLKVVVQSYAFHLGHLLSAMDQALAVKNKFTRTMSGWESIGRRKRSIVSLFGFEITYCRRGYRKNLDGRITYRYPLDEFLGLKEGERFCPLTQEMAICLAARMPFREAAFILNHYLGIPVTHQVIHKWVTEAGRTREEELKKGEEAVFLDGEIPPGREEIDTLLVEADGVIVPLQRSKDRQVELKLGVCHQGSFPTDPSKKRFALKNKFLWGGVMDASSFWERIAGDALGTHYSTFEVIWKAGTYDVRLVDLGFGSIITFLAMKADISGTFSARTGQPKLYPPAGAVGVSASEKPPGNNANIKLGDAP